MDMNISQSLHVTFSVAPTDKINASQIKESVEVMDQTDAAGSHLNKSKPDVIYSPADLAALVGTTRADGCVYVEPWGDKEIAEFSRMRGLEAYAATRLKDMNELFNNFKQSLFSDFPDGADKVSGFTMSGSGAMQITCASNSFDAMTTKMLNERLNSIPGLGVLMLQHSSVVLEWAKLLKEKQGEVVELTLSDLAGAIDYGSIFSDPGGNEEWSSSWKSQVYKHFGAAAS
jgi:hypothetical protein